ILDHIQRCEVRGDEGDLESLAKQRREGLDEISIIPVEELDLAGFDLRRAVLFEGCAHALVDIKRNDLEAPSRVESRVDTRSTSEVENARARCCNPLYELVECLTRQPIGLELRDRPDVFLPTGHRMLIL